MSTDKNIYVQGIRKSKVVTTPRFKVKIILGCRVLQKEKSLHEERLPRQPPAKERPNYIIPRAIFRLDKGTMGTQYPINKDERDLEIKDSVRRRHAQSVSTELTRSEPNRCNGRLANHHPKSATHYKNEEGSIIKTSIHSVAVTTTCSELDDDSSLL